MQRGSVFDDTMILILVRANSHHVATEARHEMYTQKRKPGQL